MKISELKQQIDKVLGNDIRCLLPSYWWKKLFHSIADKIEEVEEATNLTISSLDEFKRKHPDIESRTCYLLLGTEPNVDELCEKNRSVVAKTLMSASMTKRVKPLYIATPLLPSSIQQGMYQIISAPFYFNPLSYGFTFTNVPMYDGKLYNVSIFDDGTCAIEECNNETTSFATFVLPIGSESEEIKSLNKIAFEQVQNAVRDTINNGKTPKICVNVLALNALLLASSVAINDTKITITHDAFKMIVNSDGSSTIETIESTSDIATRELKVGTNLSAADKAYNLETIDLYKQGKALVSFKSSTSDELIIFPYYNDGEFRYTTVTEGGSITIGFKCDSSGNVTTNYYRYPIDSALSTTSKNAIQNKVVTAALDTKVDKVSGKQLSTEDFTTALKTKLEGLNNYNDAAIQNAISTLRGDFDKLVSGDTTTAIKTFNEIIAFLDGISDSEDLDSIIAGIEQQISNKQDKLVSGSNIKTINNQSILGSGNIVVNAADEVYVGSTPPTDENITVWIDPDASIGDVDWDGIIVDEELSPNSTNPIQNKTVYALAARLDGIEAILDNING